MNYTDKELTIKTSEEFTHFKPVIEKLVKDEKLNNAVIVCWVPHEVASIVQLGWEEGLLDDLKAFLKDTAPNGKWTKHDEPGTPFDKNFYEHIRTKLIGNVSMSFIIKDKQLVIGQYQDLYFYSPVFKHKPEHKVICRILKLD